MRPTTRSVLVSFALLASACDQVTRLDVGAGECVPTEVQAAFDRSCGGASCHTDRGLGGGLALGAGQAASAIGRPSVGSPLPLIELGNTAGSYLAQKIMPTPTVALVGERMPVGLQSGNADQVADVNTILGWIAGAEYASCSVDTGDTGETGDTGNVANGLPCEVDDVLATYCRSCHGDPPIGATFSLLSLDDMLADAPTDASKSVGEQSVARMMDDARPMPPTPAARPSAAEIAIIADWVAAGMPAGDCTVGPNPFDVEPVCTSKKYWTDGDEEDPRMHPGRACITCHEREDEGPIFELAGTVYPTGHEPNECYGASSILVRVTDANGLVAEVKSNSAGNFMLRRGDAPDGFAPPYMIELVSDVGERAMAMPAPHGDCNACHTQDGDENAPGRIVFPW